MKTQKGIALIATLMIMAATMTLGFGSLFLTDMNLRISENARSNAIAKSHADAGIDAAYVLLSRHFELNRFYPPHLSLPAVEGQDYQLLEYRPPTANSDRAVVRVEGFGSNNARYVAEAVFQADTYRAFEVGITSRRIVSTTGGGGADFMNSGIHGNGGVSFSGGSWNADAFKQCTLNGRGECIAGTTRTATPTPVSSSGRTSCSSPCFTNDAPPVEVDVKYNDQRSDTIAMKTFGLVRYRGTPERDGTGELLYAHPDFPNTPISINPANTNPSYGLDPYNPSKGLCTKSFSGDLDLRTSSVNNAGFSANDVVCVQGSVTFPANVNLTNVTVIAHGNINFGSTTTTGAAGNLTNVKLITRNDVNPQRNGVMLSSARGENLTIFSGANTFPNNKNPYFLIDTGYDLHGYTTIASSEDILFRGKSNVTMRNGVETVTIAVISQKNIDNGGSFNYFGTFWAGGTFEQNGSSVVYGGIATVENISVTGKFKVLRNYPIYNDYLLGDTVALSRR